MAFSSTSSPGRSFNVSAGVSPAASTRRRRYLARPHTAARASGRNTPSWNRSVSPFWEMSDTPALGELTAALRGETGWSRSTVLTYLTRMEAKGLVAIDSSGYPRRYRAALDRDACQAQARKNFLQQVYQGATGDLVAAFLKEKPIPARERDELRRLLDEMEV